jgi:hypothetical protein
MIQQADRHQQELGSSPSSARQMPSTGKELDDKPRR